MTGEILVLSRSPDRRGTVNVPGWGRYRIQTVTTPGSLFTFLKVKPTRDHSRMSDYLVQAFDRGFASKMGFDAAFFVWRLPSGEIVPQHST